MAFILRVGNMPSQGSQASKSEHAVKRCRSGWIQLSWDDSDVFVIGTPCCDKRRCKGETRVDNKETTPFQIIFIQLFSKKFTYDIFLGFFFVFAL
jgi:hypothetical protein